MLDPYVLACIGSGVIMIAYLAIAASIVVQVLLEDQQWRTNPLATATAMIFFSCGVGHGLHLEHLIVYGRGAVGMYDWHLALWDLSTAVIGVWYWTLRSRLSALKGTGMLFQDARAAESARLSALLGELFDGVVVWSAEAPAGAEPWLDRLRPADRRRVEDLRARAAGGEETAETVVVDGDGTGWAVRAAPLEPGTVLLAWRDVSDAVREVEQRRSAQAELAAAFDAAPVPMVLLADSVVLRGNGALAQLTGAGAGSSWAGLFVEEQRQEAAERLARAAGGQACTDWEVALLLPGGDVRRVSASLAPVHGSEPPQVVAHLVDLEERKRYEERLRHVSEHDPLTGLANRRRFETELTRQCDLATRYATTGALLMIDLDNFKDVNDTLGHAVGDQLIVSVARVVERQIRPSDVLARLGGDEFAVILPHADEAAAEDVAGRICREVHRHSRSLSAVDATGRVTASIGVAMFGDVTPTPDAMLMAADLTLYDAKEAGRNTWSLYRGTAHDQPRTKSRLEWLERLRTALETNALVVVAQPLQDLRDGTRPLEELLLRLADPSGQLVPPARFLYIAEQTDLICDVDRWMLRFALERLEQTAGGLCVNVSGRSLSVPAVVADLEAMLEEHAGVASRLVLEVTETAAVANLHDARDALNRFQAHGCRVALDDFGAGFGSLAYVKHLPFDILKIDGQFVEACREDPVDRTVIDAVVSLARGLGKEIVAEHVPDEATMDVLRERGVTYAQGYHVGRPQRVDAVVPGPRAELPDAVGPHAPFPCQPWSQAPGSS